MPTETSMRRSDKQITYINMNVIFIADMQRIR